VKPKTDTAISQGLCSVYSKGKARKIEHNAMSQMLHTLHNSLFSGICQVQPGLKCGSLIEQGKSQLEADQVHAVGISLWHY
jgi:hypothetical protein